MLKFEKFLEAREEDFYNLSNLLNRHQYYAAEKGLEPIDLINSDFTTIKQYLHQIGKLPSGEDQDRFVAKLKQLAKGSFVPEEDLRRLRKGLF